MSFMQHIIPKSHQISRNPPPSKSLVRRQDGLGNMDPYQSMQSSNGRMSGRKLKLVSERLETLTPL